MCKIHQYLVKIWTRVWSLIFWLILKVKLCFVLDRLSVFVNIRRQYCLTGWAGQKLSSKLLFIYSPNSDGFYIFHISQGSVATQLRCGGMFGNHFITNFLQNAPAKKFWESVNISQRYGQNFVAYFCATLYSAFDLKPGHPRSFISALIEFESAYGTSYRSSIETLVLSCRISEI